MLPIFRTHNDKIFTASARHLEGSMMIHDFITKGFELFSKFIDDDTVDVRLLFMYRVPAHGSAGAGTEQGSD